MANNGNGNGNGSRKPQSSGLVFEVINDDNEVIGKIIVDPGVRISQPNKTTGKGGGKEYITAEMTLDFGESGKFGGKVSLWPPRETTVSESRAVVRSL